MKSNLPNLLRCSYCGGTISVCKVNREAQGEILYGLIKCDACSQRYAIVEGIPILRSESEYVDVKAETTDGVVFPGPRCRELIGLLANDKVSEALERLINPPTDNVALPALGHANAILKKLRLSALAGKLNRSVLQYTAAAWRRNVLQEVQALSASGTAADVLKLYYDGRFKSELLNYFFYRFGQPRHLVALSLTHLLTQRNGAALDLACGIGHLTHYLCSQSANRQVVGVDRNFFQLLIAKKFICRSADFVCCEADGTLPFAEAAFGSVLCSDAFHYFLDRFRSAVEMQRVLAPNGAIAVSRIGNALVAPNEGYELRPSGYRQLFSGIPTTVVTEESVLARYLHKRGPDLSTEAPPAMLDAAKWLSVIASHDATLRQDHQAFRDWPHAAGRLRVNPIYEREAVDNDATTYRFRFPSKWYAVEDKDYLRYAPETVRIESATLAAMAEGKRTGEIDALIERCVVVGMPERYM